ncbi:hypothetical protein KCP71_08690 [Salmonella enterica subsp. enterica]|nr:hypothetical protein KCP71_08690 [Salmonella enterica subsp. enterica]
MIAVTGSEAARDHHHQPRFVGIFAQLNLHAAEVKATVFIVTPARKWTWRSQSATPGGISLFRA